MDASAKMSLENKHWCKHDHFAIISCGSHSVSHKDSANGLVELPFKQIWSMWTDLLLSVHLLNMKIFKFARRFTQRGIGVYKKLKNRTDNKRKPKLISIKTESRKTCTHLRSLRRIFFKEKPEKHRTASNGKSGNPILFLLKNREWNGTENANRKSQKPKNRSFWVQKPI